MLLQGLLKSILAGSWITYHFYEIEVNVVSQISFFFFLGGGGGQKNLGFFFTQFFFVKKIFVYIIK